MAGLDALWLAAGAGAELVIAEHLETIVVMFDDGRACIAFESAMPRWMPDMMSVLMRSLVFMRGVAATAGGATSAPAPN